MNYMITANRAKQITIQSFASELEDIELEIKEAAKRGLTSIKLSEGLWNDRRRYESQTSNLTRIIKEFGYNINYTGSRNEITEISWRL